MLATVYVVGSTSDHRRFVRAAVASTSCHVEGVADVAGLFARWMPGQVACVVAFADTDAAGVLALVREVRERTTCLPLIVLGPYSAFRAAIDIARLPATDFLEMPVTNRQLSGAVGKALRAIAGRKRGA